MPIFGICPFIRVICRRVLYHGDLVAELSGAKGAVASMQVTKSERLLDDTPPLVYCDPEFDRQFAISLS